MPYIIFTVYNKSYGEIYEPYIYQIGNEKEDFREYDFYKKCIEDIKNDLMKDYKGCDFDEIFMMEEFIVDKINKII